MIDDLLDKANRATLYCACALKNMLHEMLEKDLDLARVTRAGAALLSGGVARCSIPHQLIPRCLKAQKEDGGWIGITDTMWNLYFLKRYAQEEFWRPIQNGIEFLNNQQTVDGLWGRSARDRSRIPVTGMLLYFLPELATESRLLGLELLWWRERDSLAYKAGYTLMALGSHHHVPKQIGFYDHTIRWLCENQRPDGSFGPWKDHPAPSTVYWTAVAVLGLLQYPDLVPVETIQKGIDWIISHQMRSGIWPYHEVDEGAAWALLCLSTFLKVFGRS